MPSKLEARVTQNERQIAAIRTLVQTGMRMLVKIEGGLLKIEGGQVAIQKDVRELAAAQRETDRMLKGLIRSLEKGSNGHSGQQKKS